jgi:membrane associated rhomboid family serine protease
MSITGYIIFATGIISVLAFQNRQLRDRLIFNPYVIEQRRQWYRFITSGLIHADWIHLFINMIVFYSFGQVVESDFNNIFDEKGDVNYLLVYFGGMVISVVPTFKKNKDNPSYNSLGASGAVSAIVFASILLRPLQSLYVYFLPMPAIIFGSLYLIYCYWSSKRASSDYINHDAHLWGAIFGFVFTIFLKPQLFLEFLNQLPFFHANF